VEGLDVSITGFSPVEIDQLTVDFEEDASNPDVRAIFDAGSLPPSQRTDAPDARRHRSCLGKMCVAVSQQFDGVVIWKQRHR
jgi:hypothetical protein